MQLDNNWQPGTKTDGIRHRTEGESAGEGATGAAEKGEPGMKPKELKEVTGKLNTKDALFKAAKEYIRMYRTQKAGLK
ncbi:MAG: hypothetical protein Q8P40_00480 [Nitrospirota bacterium]|nr:hypothetical protein [Nitrospirota bacterium]